MTLIGLIALGAIQDDHLQAGIPARLTNAMDYTGKICGYDTERKDLKYGYYLPDFTGKCLCTLVLLSVVPHIFVFLICFSGLRQELSLSE
ncbi:hypothetical protein EON65_11720 [archaeon]|nr:MAG: hypothetical protein EON65_11720 [archaeon]